MVAIAKQQPVCGKSPRHMLRTLATDLLRNLDDPRYEVATLAAAAHQYAAMIDAECERERGQEVTR